MRAVTFDRFHAEVLAAEAAAFAGHALAVTIAAADV